MAAEAPNLSTLPVQVVQIVKLPAPSSASQSTEGHSPPSAASGGAVSGAPPDHLFPLAGSSSWTSPGLHARSRRARPPTTRHNAWQLATSQADARCSTSRRCSASSKSLAQGADRRSPRSPAARAPEKRLNPVVPANRMTTDPPRFGGRASHQPDPSLIPPGSGRLTSPVQRRAGPGTHSRPGEASCPIPNKPADQPICSFLSGR